jgi:hypothetical protein
MPQRSRLELLRELLGSLSFWPKAVMGTAAMAAAALIVFALIGTSASLGQQGFSIAFGRTVNESRTPQPQMLTRAEAEALVEKVAAQVRAQAQDEMRAQLASLEERMKAERQAELATTTKRLYAEQRAIMARANQQEMTLREWLFAGNDMRDGGGTENDRNK